MKQIPFEIHITTIIRNKVDEEGFLSFCGQNNVKPLFIELARGQSVSQPMLSKTVYLESLVETQSYCSQISAALNKKGFPTQRIKIEVLDRDSELFVHTNTSHAHYFEWHGKVSYQNFNTLLKYCEKNQVHLSRNVLKNEANQRFITLREYGNKAIFHKRIDRLKKDLQNGGWKLFKEEAEYCIYDDNKQLDKNWLKT
jgi:hypothetical protein